MIALQASANPVGEEVASYSAVAQPTAGVKPAQGDTRTAVAEAFDEILEQLSPSAIAATPATGTADRVTVPAQANTVTVPPAAPVPGTPPKTTTVCKPINKKDVAPGSAPPPKDHQTDLLFPMDVAVPPPVPEPLRNDFAQPDTLQRAESAPVSPIQPHLQPEPAITIAIRHDDRGPVAPPAPVQSEAPIASANDFKLPLTPAQPAIANSGEAAQVAAPAIAISGEQAKEQESDAVTPTPVAAPQADAPAPADIEHKKNQTALSQAGSDADSIRSTATQTSVYQDVPIKREANGPENTAFRNDASHQTTAESAPADKPPAQPLRSVALEFSPDGSKDVRVRLAERGGEVHISLHSNDPAVSRSLRDGVIDLSTTLTNAGYDNRSWTSGRQQDNRQQQEEAQQPRSQHTLGGQAAFDDVLQHEPNQENS